MAHKQPHTCTDYTKIGLFTGTTSTKVRGTARKCGYRENSGDYPDSGVMLDSTPGLPAANDVFSKEELRARLEIYSDRAKVRQPLFPLTLEELWTKFIVEMR